MLQFENFKNNIEISDKFQVNNIKTDKSVIYNGHHKTFAHEKAETIKQPLAASVLGLNNTDIPLPDDVEFHNCYSDMDAQESYLKLKPKTFLILGKQGTGSYSLGEALSKKRNCIHLCPKNLLLDEIDQKSITGQCLDFNMRHNKVCKFNTILSIMKQKLESPAVQHRGFVISGLPLVTSNSDIKYLINTLHGEESLVIIEFILYDLICNLKKKKLKPKISSLHSSISSDNVREEEIIEEQELELGLEAEEREQIAELPKYLLEPCSNIIFPTKMYYKTKKTVLLQQLYELFDLQPDIVIYITCPTTDAIIKRSRKFLNYLGSVNTFSQFNNNIDNEVRWPAHYNMIDYRKSFETHNYNPKYNCAQPIHFKKNAKDQICNYKYTVTSFIEEKLKEFDTHNVLKLDGRTSIHQMINHTIQILQLMPIKPVLTPEPLYLEESPDDMEEFWRKVEELNVIRSGIMSFNRYASPWYNRCPVELQKRRSMQGNPKFAVTFFKHIYLLYSLDAMVLFCKNPRPFLKLEYLEPTCRIITLGTKSSGKTMVAKCLSWIFDAPFICYSTFLQNETQKKYNHYAKTIFSEIIATIEDTRIAKWQSLELERISTLNTWFNTVSSLLASYVPLLIQKLNEKDQEYTEEDFVFLNKFNAIRNQLSFLPVDDLHKCQDALIDNNVLKYAPSDLITEITKPTTPNLGDEDVIQQISAYINTNDLYKEIEPTPEELMTEMIKLLQIIDSKSDQTLTEQVYGKFIIDGFPSDPEFWEYLIESKLLPDYTIVLVENRELNEDLIQHYVKIGKRVKNYAERYTLANDTLLKTKLLHNDPPDTTLVDIQIIIDETISDTLDSIFVNVETDNTEKQNYSDFLTSFAESVERFREGWDNIKLKLEENFKSFIEVELEDKSDIQVLDEALLKVRQSYCKPCLNSEEEPDDHNNENESSKNDLTYNDSHNLGETNIYCPISFYDYGVLWQGKSEFSAKYDNKLYYFSKEECGELLKYDITKYLSYNKPIKNIPPLRICVIGSIGSGKTTLSKILAKELGLIHVDYAHFLNCFLLPKHFKKVGWQYENSFIDTIIDDEEANEFQIDEENLNIYSDLLSNEQELRRLMNDYFERGSPLLSVLMQPMIKKLWFDNPFRNTGIVIDGFPKLPADIEDMVTCFCIPDVIIELEGSSETTLERLSPIKLKKWKSQLNEAKMKAKMKLEAEKKKWLNFITKTIVVKLIIDEVIENTVIDTEGPIINLSAQVSTIMDAHPSGSSNVDANLFTTYNEFIQEHPEPIDENEWENPEDALEKINSRLESIFEIDDENIQTLKETTDEQKIKILSLNGRKPLNKVIRKTLSKLSKFRFRCESFLEQTFIINCDIAEMLLLEGFFLLSKFNRMCPVFISENPHTILNTYNLHKRRNEIFPIIHRAYIYFICFEENVKKFRENPLKYVQNDTIEHFRGYSLRIGIIGPPKSGKSKLAASLAKKYGLMCISKGMAIRYILEHMDWTVLGLKMMALLREGQMIDNELIIKAVLIVAIDNRTITNGFILDGFPESPNDVHALSEYGLFPLIIFDLNTDKNIVLTNSQNELHYDILKEKPPYPRPFVEFRYNKWYDECSKVRNSINEDTQNIHIINENKSKWQRFFEVCTVIENIIPKIHHYLVHSNNKIVRVDEMCISKNTFQQRMSCYQNLCPVCFHKNILRHSDYPPDNNGLVQYESCFYWICPDHLNLVLQYPQKFLCSKKINIPEIPAVVKSINQSLVYENGICIVTYAENLPSQKILRGQYKFAASYKKNTYSFCNAECLNKFLMKPHMYYDIKVFNETNIFPKMALNKLPHLGYLEQTLGNIITDACCAVNVLRPKYPGLTSHLSALIHIGLYLKTHNSILNKSLVPIYSKALKVFEARCKLMIEIGLRLRSTDNPFAKYPKCCGNYKAKQIDSGTVRKPSTIISTSTSSVYLESDFNKLL